MSKHQDPATSNDGVSAKRASVLGTSTKRRAPWIAILLSVSVVAGIGYLILSGKVGGVAPAVAAPTKTAASKEVSFAVSDFSDGSAKFYQLSNSAGPTVRYFVVKAADGTLKTAYDACDACWHAGKGYEQSGAAMICRNCRRSFEIARIGEEQGGCNPAPLKSRVQDGALVIDTTDIFAGSRYFDLANVN